MLVIIIMKFFFCIIFDVILLMFYKYGYIEDNFRVCGIWEFMDMFLVFNVVINFVVYCVLSVIFWMNCKKLFCYKEVLVGDGGDRWFVYKLLLDRLIFWK